LIDVGLPYDLDSDGTTLSGPVTITLPFDPTKVPPGTASSDVVYAEPSMTTTGNPTRSPLGRRPWSTRRTSRPQRRRSEPSARASSSPTEPGAVARLPAPVGQSCVNGFCRGG
jgi:hypothetical protein